MPERSPGYPEKSETFIIVYNILYVMATYTAQMSFGGLQYERLMKWMAKEKYKGRPDVFVRDQFMKLLDAAVPPEEKSS